VRWLSRVLGSVFFSGYSPLFPATVGSAVTCVAYWFLVPHHPFTQLAIIAVVFFLGLYVSSKLVSEWGPDPRRVVIDEAAGMLLSLYMLPRSLFWVILAFLFFRFFDIAKPFLVRRLEGLQSAWGIMLDDLLAGIYARVGVLIMYSIWVRIR
jgi:phosphatidylglycerophosphatase A